MSIDSLLLSLTIEFQRRWIGLQDWVYPLQLKASLNGNAKETKPFFYTPIFLMAVEDHVVQKTRENKILIPLFPKQKVLDAG